MPPTRTARTAERSCLAVALVGAVLLAGCQPQQAAQRGAAPPPQVTVVTVEPKSVPVIFEYVGQSAGSREVEVRARVTGILLKRNYREGGKVQSGQSLFTIDPVPFRAALNRAEADLAGAQARLDQARRNAERLRSLSAAKVVSQKEHDDAESAEQIAAAELKSARAKLVEARWNLENTRVAAPIAGTSSRALKSEGSLVSGPDVLLTSVTQTDPIYVNFGISENEQLKLRRDVEAGRVTLPKDDQFDVQVQLGDGTLYDKTGKLGFTDVRVSPTTGTSDARASLPNPDGVLQPGQFVRVRLAGALRPNAVLIPQRAVLDGPQGKFVYVLDAESKAEARPVEAGDWAGEDWVIDAGLKSGDRVIIDGMMKIGPGAPVRVAGPGDAGPRSSVPVAR